MVDCMRVSEVVIIKADYLSSFIDFDKKQHRPCTNSTGAVLENRGLFF